MWEKFSQFYIEDSFREINSFLKSGNAHCGKTLTRIFREINYLVTLVKTYRCFHEIFVKKVWGQISEISFLWNEVWWHDYNGKINSVKSTLLWIERKFYKIDFTENWAWLRFVSWYFLISTLYCCGKISLIWRNFKFQYWIIWRKLFDFQRIISK